VDDDTVETREPLDGKPHLFGEDLHARGERGARPARGCTVVGTRQTTGESARRPSGPSWEHSSAKAVNVFPDPAPPRSERRSWCAKWTGVHREELPDGPYVLRTGVCVRVCRRALRCTKLYRVSSSVVVMGETRDVC
jgi:hypothetical protein